MCSNDMGKIVKVSFMLSIIFDIYHYLGCLACSCFYQVA